MRDQNFRHVWLYSSYFFFFFLTQKLLTCETVKEQAMGNFGTDEARVGTVRFQFLIFLSTLKQPAHPCTHGI